MMGSLFCLFVLEMYLNSKMGGQSHSHGGPTGTAISAPIPMPAPQQAPQRPARSPMAPMSRTESEESFEKSYAWSDAKQAYVRERE